MHFCEICGIALNVEARHSWYLCDQHGVGLCLCAVCADTVDGMDERRALAVLLAKHALEVPLTYLLAVSPARYVAALLDLGHEERAEDARQRYRVTHETIERLRRREGRH